MAQEDCQRLQHIWNEIASDDRFQQKLGDLQRQKDEWQALGQLRQRRYQQLLEGRRLAQLCHFLERFEIERSLIPGIGPARKAMLQSYNIETALDVKKNRILNVPGFGPTLAGELMKWRKELEGRFRFDANKGVDPRDVAQLDQEIAETKRRLEAGLLNGEAELKQIHDTILLERTRLGPKVEAALRAVDQARADYEAIS